MNPDAALERACLARVTGRVQGVNFRRYTERWALTLGLRGWVRNLADGYTVELYAEGPRAALDVLLRELRQGPPFARVDDVAVEWTEPRGEHAGFEVRP
jgi:acylphosphatase